MLRFKQKVKILSSLKTDGRYNYGKIVGIELLQDGYYLGYTSEKEYLARFTVPKYKVAYVDCATKNACTEWFLEKDIEIS